MPGKADTPFTRRMRQICDEAPGRCKGYTPTGLRLMIDRCGGDFLRAAKGMLHGCGVPSGLERLARGGASDISMEAVVLEEPWCRLFDPDDLAAAAWRLSRARELARVKAVVTEPDPRSKARLKA